MSLWQLAQMATLKSTNINRQLLTKDTVTTIALSKLLVQQPIKVTTLATNGLGFRLVEKIISSNGPVTQLNKVLSLCHWGIIQDLEAIFCNLDKTNWAKIRLSKLLRLKRNVRRVATSDLDRILIPRKRLRFSHQPHLLQITTPWITKDTLSNSQLTWNHQLWISLSQQTQSTLLTLKAQKKRREAMLTQIWCPMRLHRAVHPWLQTTW